MAEFSTGKRLLKSLSPSNYHSNKVGEYSIKAMGIRKNLKKDMDDSKNWVSNDDKHQRLEEARSYEALADKHLKKYNKSLMREKQLKTISNKYGKEGARLGVAGGVAAAVSHHQSNKKS